MSVFNIENIDNNDDDISEKPLIMLVDDEVENINVLRQLLESRFKIITGLNGAEALDMIDNMVDPKKVQLIISDQRMPQVTGVEFLEKIVDKMPDTIRIILTGYSDTQVIIDAINKAKLYKFMTKPFDPVELSLTVQRGVEAYQMRRELIEYSENLEHLVIERTDELNEKNEELLDALKSLEEFSLTDQLTGVHNRYFLNKMMPQEIAKFKRDNFENKHESSHFGLLIIDIDFFKQVNDTYGHDAGDKVLVTFSEILAETCRESDWIVRWGGEEFVVIARGLELKGIENLAERIRSNVASCQFDIGKEHAITITCSIGITPFPLVKGNVELLSWQQTLNCADNVLYLAKKNGRNAWVSLSEADVMAPDGLYDSLMSDVKSVKNSGEIAIRHSETIQLNNF